MRWQPVLLSISVFLALLFYSSETCLAQIKNRQSTVVSYRPGILGLPLVQIRLNERLVGTFILDTGTNFSMLADTTANSLGLNPSPSVAVNGKSQQNRETNQVVTASTLTLGSLALKNVTFQVGEAAKLKRLAGEEVSGVIGNDILSNFAVLLDFQQHQFTFIPGGNVTASERKQLDMSQAHLTTMTDTDSSRYYYITATINSVSCHLLIDTGSWSSTIPTSLAHQLTLSSLGRPTLQTLYGGEYREEATIVKTFQIEDFTVHNAIVGYASPAIVGLPALLGRNFLPVIVSCWTIRNKRCILSPLSNKFLLPRSSRQRQEYLY